MTGPVRGRVERTGEGKHFAPRSGAYPYPPPPYTGGHGDGFHLKELIGVIRRRSVIILATVCIVTALAALFGFQVTPRYMATAEVMIEPRQTRIIDLGSVVDELPPDFATVESQMRLLTSSAHAQDVIEEFGLLADPEFNPVLEPDGVERALLTTLRDWLPDRWLTATGVADQVGPQSEERDDSEAPHLYEYERQMAAATRSFLSRLTVSQGGRSYAVSISFTSTDPEKAARIANAVAELYVQGQLEAKVAATTGAISWLAERAEQLRERVLESERAVEEYRAVNELVDGRGLTLDGEQVARLNVALVTARAERAEKEVRLRRARELRESGAGYESLAEVMSSPVIIRLRQEEAVLLREEAQLAREYGERHPRILQLRAEKQNLAAKIDDEIHTIIRSLENELAVARSRERALGESLEEAKDESTSHATLISRAGIQLRQLEREAQATRSLYTTFLTRLQETRELQELLQPNARVISTADAPSQPSFPKRKLMMAAGFTASLMLGGLLAFLAECLDSRLRTGRQLEEVLGVPTLALVPSIRRLKRHQKPHVYLLEKPLSAYAEAIRALQKAVQLSDRDRPPRVVLVTSTLPGEGKTTLAVSLGASAARSGLKTAVVDLDLRHPSVAREMDQPVGADLVEFLAGEAALDEIIHTSGIQSNLDFIPVERLTASPLDLLECPKMSSLLAELRARYDYIVLDTPPALGLTDTKAAALVADAILFAVQWEKTKAEVALNGLEALADGGVAVTGLVLTRVDLRRHTKYGYGDVGQYYGTYKKYYLN